MNVRAYKARKIVAKCEIKDKNHNTIELVKTISQGPNTSYDTIINILLQQEPQKKQN